MSGWLDFASLLRRSLGRERSFSPAQTVRSAQGDSRPRVVSPALRPDLLAEMPLPTGPRPRLQPGEAFTPTQPRQGRRQLVGRTAELDRIVQALREDHAHVVIYAERGRGKTSFANAVVEMLRQSGMIVARHTCGADSSFDTIMRGLARDLPESLLAVGVGAGEDGCGAALPPGELGPRDVLALPSRLTCRSLVCLIDEFDRIEDEQTSTRIADTIKQLSDRGVPLYFMIVGVADNLVQILGRHPSIQRNLVAIQLPVMTDIEVSSIVERGGKQAGFEFPADISARIAILARGNPYMAQLLGLRLTQAAAARAGTAVSEADLSEATERLIQEASPADALLYAGLTSSGRDGAMVTALRRIATAEQDEYGRLLTVPNGDGVAVGEYPIAGPQWRRILESEILCPLSEGSGLYALKNRFLMHYVLLLASRKLVQTEADPSAEVLHLPTLTRVNGAV